MNDTDEVIRREAERFARDLAAEASRYSRLVNLERRGERAADNLRDGLTERPLSIELKSTIEVLIGTGGPACGVRFQVSRQKWGWEMESGSVWWQDWFTPKVYEPLDDETAQTLFDLWGCESDGATC